VNSRKKKKELLKKLALVVWYSGFIALALKSYTLFKEAYALNSNLYLMGLFLLLAFLLALLKTKYIFIKSCKKNLERIEGLENPRFWNFYRKRFFLFLAIVISLGAFLSRWASGDYSALIAVAVIDMALSLALFFSSFLFWKR
jgi:hypothetical protein